MKNFLKIIPVLLLLFQQAQSQVYQDIKTWYKYNRFKVDNVFRPPVDTLPSLTCADTGATATKQGVLYVFTKVGSICKWVEQQGGEDTTAGIGVNITRLNPKKVLFEHKEIMFTGTSDLRAWTVPVTENYIYKVVVDDTMTREFKYDPNDVLSADNGVTVIVNSLGHRFKLETTVLNGAKFGMRGDFDAGTGAGFDNTSAMRKMFSLFTGSKNARNLAVQVPAGEYGFLDTLATPNSAGFFTIRGEGKYTTTLWYKGPTGKDFLTMRNAQKATLEDFEMASYTHASAMIRLTTDAGIIGSSGMVSHVLLRNIDMRGNRGAYDYGIRKTSTPDHDQNNEQTLLENCFIDLPEITAYSNEMFNALWDRAENCYFSGKRRALSIAKPNPGGTVDSAGGSIDLINCTVMTLSGADTLLYIVGGQATFTNCRSEGPGRTMIYARKSAEGSQPIIRVTSGTFTMGLAQGTGIPQGEYNINAAGAYITLDGTILNPAGLLKFRITDSTTYTDIRGGNVNIDSIWYSSIIVQEIPGYAGNSVTKRMQLYADKGNYKIVKAVSNSREITSTNATPDLSGESYFPFAPTAPTTFTNFLGKQPFDEITIHALNGNVTIANNSNIITNTGGNIVMQANQVLKLHRTSMAFGGSWIVHTGAVFPPSVSNNTFPIFSTTSNRFVNSLFSQSGGELFSGTTINTPQIITNLNGIIISDPGNYDKQLQLQSTDPALLSGTSWRNSSGDKLYAGSYGNTSSRSRQGLFAFDGPGALKIDHLGAGAEIDLDIAGSNKFKINTTTTTTSQPINFSDANTQIANNSGDLELRTQNGTPKFTVTTTGGAFNGNVAYKAWQTITTGTTTTLGNTISTCLTDPASLLASHTITMPASPVDGQEIAFVFGGTITSGAVVTTLTISANSGQGLIQAAAPATANAGDSFIYRYKSSNTKWYRIK